MFFTYILSLSNGKYYIGQTNNIQNRLYRHEGGQVRSTKAFRPLKLVYYEQFAMRSESMHREIYLKSLKSHNAIKDLIISSDGPIV